MNIPSSNTSSIPGWSNPVSLCVDLGQSDGFGGEGTEIALSAEALTQLVTGDVG
jgi:hypothetical protein